MRDLQVRKMFETIAGSYDFQNSFLSLRRDTHWRNVLVAAVHAGRGDYVLDAATGTAEVALNLCRRNPDCRVVGLDFSPRMLAMGRKKVACAGLGQSIHLSLGDSRRLPLKDACVATVTMAFGIRNIEERREVLAEFHRVLKPGGELFIMEFDLPDPPLLKSLYRFYFDRILPPVGNWISRTNYAYSYLAKSVHGFPSQESFLREIAEAGFHRTAVRKLTFGIAKIFRGIKQEGRR